MTLRLYDTYAREKRDFVPAEPGRITMYLCGPTVYGRAHIGNARPAVVFDVLARLIRHLYPNHRLDYARNITDVDDKIIAAAAAEGVDPQVITDRFERHYLEDTAALGVTPPPIQPHATTHVPDMIAMIARLVELGHAYAAEGHVLFSVASDPAYGSLSRRNAEAMRAGARIEVAPYKRDAGDFILWKPSDPDVIGWDSPWGRGRPGWHIECSAMIERHLGTTIDIHAGGQDLIFPHHENEAAQSRCAHNGKPLANIWMHNGFVNMGGGDKMSKSVGNVVGISDLPATRQRGETLRLGLLSAHYRQPLEWTEALVAQLRATLNGLYRRLENVDPEDAKGCAPAPGVLEALGEDLNTPAAIASLLTIREPKTLRQSASLLGLLTETSASWFGKSQHVIYGGPTIHTSHGSELTDERIEQLKDERENARQRRDFAEADRIRAELDADGILLEDTPTGTTWRRA